MKNNGLLSVIACCACTLAMFMTSCAKKVYIPAQDTTVSTPTTPKLPNGEVELITFCIDDAYDKPGEYMAGLGIAEDRPDRARAITDANRVAIPLCGHDKKCDRRLQQGHQCACRQENV